MFFLRQLKHEAIRESSRITLHGLIERFCRDSIQFRQIPIQQDLPPTNRKDPRLDEIVANGRYLICGNRHCAILVFAYHAASFTSAIRLSNRQLDLSQFATSSYVSSHTSSRPVSFGWYTTIWFWAWDSVIAVSVGLLFKGSFLLWAEYTIFQRPAGEILTDTRENSEGFQRGLCYRSA
jgi:hypothetical protein